MSISHKKIQKCSGTRELAMLFAGVKKLEMICTSVNRATWPIAHKVADATCQITGMRYRSLLTLTHTREPQGRLLN